MIKILTNSEAKLMSVLWSLPGGRGHGTEIVRAYDAPQPALTTVLTFLKILERKGYVFSRREGRSNMFTATVTKEEYMELYIQHMRDDFFNGSNYEVAQFLLKHNFVTADELRRIADEG